MQDLTQEWQIARLVELNGSFRVAHPSHHNAEVNWSLALQGQDTNGRTTYVPRPLRSQASAGINNMTSCWSRDSLKEISSVPSDFHAGEPTSRRPTSEALATTRK